MRKIILYIAVSLNGKIARPNGSVDWLESMPNPEKTDYGYAEFLKSIDTTIQGHKTYKQLIRWGIPFPYTGKTNYVLTRNPDLQDNENVKFVKSNHPEFFKDLKNQEGKGIWLIGGGQINTLFLKEDLIDELRIFLMPIVIPGGIEIFDLLPRDKLLNLIETKSFSSGVVELKYTLKKHSLKV